MRTLTLSAPVSATSATSAISASFAFFAVFTTALAPFCLAGCDVALPPATAASNTVPAPGPGESLVTFLRGTSPCDTGEYAIIVDEHARFVGNLAAGTQLSYATHPGPHTFYAWSNVDLVITKEPAFSAVAATRVKAHAGETEYVILNSQKPCEARARFELFDLRAADTFPDPVAAHAEAIELVHETRPVTTDQAAGQIAIESRPAHLRYFLEQGARTLERIDSERATNHRRRALWKEEDALE